jgi:hypothetical protein
MGNSRAVGHKKTPALARMARVKTMVENQNGRDPERKVETS